MPPAAAAATIATTHSQPFIPDRQRYAMASTTTATARSTRSRPPPGVKILRAGSTRRRRALRVLVWSSRATRASWTARQWMDAKQTGEPRRHTAGLATVYAPTRRVVMGSVSEISCHSRVDGVTLAQCAPMERRHAGDSTGAAISGMGRRSIALSRSQSRASPTPPVWPREESDSVSSSIPVLYGRVVGCDVGVPIPSDNSAMAPCRTVPPRSTCWG